jgi:hypothetical protein
VSGIDGDRLEHERQRGRRDTESRRATDDAHERAVERRATRRQATQTQRQTQRRRRLRARRTRAERKTYERMYAATFDAVQSPTLGQAQRDDGADRRVQAVFLSLFVTLLYDYHAYIQYVRRYPTPVAVFNKATFVRDNGVAARFLASLVDTQAFAVFLEERHAVAENLFDIAVRHAHSLMEVETKQRFGAPTTTLKMYRAALTLPELLSRLDGDILRLPCLASDVTETYVVPGPDCHDFGSAAVFDYAAPGAPAFPHSTTTASPRARRWCRRRARCRTRCSTASRRRRRRRAGQRGADALHAHCAGAAAPRHVARGRRGGRGGDDGVERPAALVVARQQRR